VTRRPKIKRAIGIVRVSRRAGRKGENFVSPKDQRGRVKGECERENLSLLRIEDEIDVSGRTPLAKREVLLAAVEAVEAGEADVIVAAYFDRLARSLQVQQEVVSRVEAAGGQVLAVGFGEISNGTATQWITSGILGLVNEFVVRQGAEKSAEAQVDAIARGVPPSRLPPGICKVQVPKGHPDYGRVEPDPETAPHISAAYQLRADGATVDAVRVYLRAHGIERSFHAVCNILSNPLYLGEIHFGDYEPNLAAFEPPVVDRDLWNQVQRIKVPRGRRAKSDRLLARLAVLRCASCGARMVVGDRKKNGRPFYRCPPTGDCTHRAAISAEVAEATVVEHTRAALANRKGRASVADNARRAEAELARHQDALDAAIRAFSVVSGEQAAVEKIGELREARDNAQVRVDHLGPTRPSLVIDGAADWDRLALDGKRKLIRLTVAEALVRPGRGTDRIAVELVG
jgi:DNA invertase Pin-like site-specific DNA recombinase